MTATLNSTFHTWHGRKQNTYTGVPEEIEAGAGGAGAGEGEDTGAVTVAGLSN